MLFATESCHSGGHWKLFASHTVIIALGTVEPSSLLKVISPWTLELFSLLTAIALETFEPFLLEICSYRSGDIGTFSLLTAAALGT